MGGCVELEEGDCGIPGCGGGWGALLNIWDTCILGAIVPVSAILRTGLLHWRYFAPSRDAG